AALDVLLEEKREYDIDNDSSCREVVLALAHKILENLFTDMLDYKSLIDSHFRYLYTPRTEWAKFTKMVIFLRNVRQYISEAYQEIDLESVESYYDDLSKVKQYDLEIQAVVTSNYNSLIKDELDSNQMNDITVY